jgi:hypothetical protein
MSFVWASVLISFINRGPVLEVDVWFAVTFGLKSVLFVSGFSLWFRNGTAKNSLVEFAEGSFGPVLLFWFT